jgi:hypothetical protein
MPFSPSEIDARGQVCAVLWTQVDTVGQIKALEDAGFWVCESQLLGQKVPIQQPPWVLTMVEQEPENVESEQQLQNWQQPLSWLWWDLTNPEAIAWTHWALCLPNFAAIAARTDWAGPRHAHSRDGDCGGAAAL